jgi:MFS family permease
MVAGIAGTFIGLVLGGALVEWNWRSIFWVNVPIGLIGTVWAYKSLHETGIRNPGRIDWWGNLTFAAGLTALLAAITYGIQPYGGHTMGWTDPWVLAGLIGGTLTLAAFCIVEANVAEPMLPLRLFRDAAFTGGNAATLLGAIARGGLQFMLIIWLQGIWLPLHGHDYADTPLWAGIYLLPLTLGFLAAGPVSGALSDRFGARPFAVAGCLVMAASFAGLLLLPTDFPYGARRRPCPDPRSLTGYHMAQVVGAVQGRLGQSKAGMKSPVRGSWSGKVRPVRDSCVTAGDTARPRR